MTAQTSSLVCEHVVVGIDPSSTRTGFALFDVADVRLVDAGYFQPPSSVKHDAWLRIIAMVDDLFELVESLKAQRVDVVVESTSGKVAKRHRGGGAGLAVYGQAVGAFMMAAHFLAKQHAHVVASHVVENEWTGGTPKKVRQIRVMQRYPQYAAATVGPRRDTGGDTSDAIGLCEWAILRRLSGGKERP